MVMLLLLLLRRGGQEDQTRIAFVCRDPASAALADADSPTERIARVVHDHQTPARSLPAHTKIVRADPRTSTARSVLGHHAAARRTRARPIARPHLHLSLIKRPRPALHHNPVLVGPNQTPLTTPQLSQPNLNLPLLPTSPPPNRAVRLLLRLLLTKPPPHQHPPNPKQHTTHREKPNQRNQHDNTHREPPGPDRNGRRRAAGGGAVVAGGGERLVEHADGLELFQRDGGVGQREEAQRGVDLRVRVRVRAHRRGGERPVWEGRVVPHNGVGVSQERDAEDHVADAQIGVSERGGGLDHADAVLGAVVVGRLGGQVEGVERDFGAVVEGDGHVERRRAGDVICFKLGLS